MSYMNYLAFAFSFYMLESSSGVFVRECFLKTWKLILFFSKRQCKYI